MSVNFRCLTIVLALAMMAALIAPVAATSQEEGGPPIYVWINQLAAQPGQSDALTAMLIEQGTKSYAPLLESGAAVNWGVAMNVVHDGGDATSHVEWISFVGWKAVDEFMAGFMAEMQAMTEEESAAQRAAWTANVVDGSHFDIINRSVIIGGKLTGRPSYIHLGYFDAAPGMNSSTAFQPTNEIHST